jgi:carboxypeptidase family protein
MGGMHKFARARTLATVGIVAGVAATAIVGVPAVMAAPAGRSVTAASGPDSGPAEARALSRMTGLLSLMPGRSGMLAREALRVARIRSALGAGLSPAAALRAGLGIRPAPRTVRRAAPAVAGSGVISGTVTASWNGQPLAGICVVAQNLISGGNRSATSAQDGSYSITGLAGSSYHVAFRGCSSGVSVVSQFWDDQESPDAATSVQVSDGQTVTGIDAAMQRAGTVGGLVTDTNNHRPSGACVHLSNNSFNEFSAKTVAGHYTIADVPAGHYLVDVGCAGYPDQQFVSPVDHQNPADYLAVPAGVTTRMNARLRIAGQISGMVVNPAGTPVSRVCVGATNVRTLIFGMALTGTTGRYTIRHLRPGRYAVQFVDCASRQRYASQWYRRQASVQHATTVPVRSYRTTHSINAKLVSGGEIAGTVSSGVTHKAVRSAAAIAIDVATGNSGIAVTGTQGRFVIRGLPTGSYQLFYLVFGGRLANVAAAHDVRVTQGRTARTAATLPLAGSVTGTVLAGQPPAPAADACVFVEPAGSGLASLVIGGGSLTGPHGAYQVTNLAPGSYVAQFTDCSVTDDQAPQWYQGTPFRGKATAITVKSGQVTSGIGGTLKPDGTLSGTVTGPGAQPLAGICVTVFPHAGDPTPVVAITGANGGYTVPTAVPGSYQVEFSSGCGATGYATAQYPSAVTVKSGTATSGIDATLVAG